MALLILGISHQSMILTLRKLIFDMIKSMKITSIGRGTLFCTVYAVQNNCLFHLLF